MDSLFQSWWMCKYAVLITDKVKRIAVVGKWGQTKFRGFGKFFLIMFSILGQPFFFLLHVFLFRNWFQVYIAVETLG